MSNNIKVKVILTVNVNYPPKFTVSPHFFLIFKTTSFALQSQILLCANYLADVIKRRLIPLNKKHLYDTDDRTLNIFHGLLIN